MKAIGIIPSRYASSRFPGKPLAIIKKKTLLERVWLRAKQSRLLDEVVIATDHRKIFDTAKSFGALAVMTSKDLKSGTDRLAEVAAKKGKSFEIFINVQGDEPLISPSLIDRLVTALKRDPSVQMVTAVYPIKKKSEIDDPNVVKAVLDKNGFAIYFSRCPIPYNRLGKKVSYFKHLGIYGYRRKSLRAFSRMAQTPLENAEQLEQLRALENGFRIKAVVSRHDSFGVDVPKDVKKIERMVK